jgi:hypothetical protein
MNTNQSQPSTPRIDPWQTIRINTVTEIAVITAIALFGMAWKRKIAPLLEHLAHILEREKVHKIISEDREGSIRRNLQKILQKTQCDRATLFFFHNSVVFASGHNYLKFSSWFEVCKDDSTSLLSQYKECQYSLVSEEIGHLNRTESNYACYNNIAEGRINQHFMRGRNVAAYGFYLIKKEHIPVAFLLIEYTWKLHCIISQSIAQVMGGHLVDKCNIEAMAEMKHISELVCG